MNFKAKDIAEMLNISTATVSLVLNDKPGVSEETRAKVYSAIKELGYNYDYLQKYTQPKVERNLRLLVYKKHGNVIGSTPFFTSVLEGCEIEARNNGCNLIINYINEDNCYEYVNQIKNNSTIDGLIILATEMDSTDLSIFSTLNIPLIILDNYFEDIFCDSVAINNVQGSYLATKHLLEMGHTEIGHLKSTVRINNFIEREDGFRKALRNSNVKYNKDYDFYVRPDLENSYKDLKDLLIKGKNLPTAFFADNDIIAIGAIKAIKEFGKKMPDDISIIGFDDMPYCEVIEPRLSTFSVPKTRMGMLAIKRLITQIENNTKESVKIEVNTTLVERDSIKKL